MYDSIFPSLGNDIIIHQGRMIFVIYHSNLAFLGDDIIKADTVFVMYYSTFKSDETGIVVYSFNNVIIEIKHTIFKLLENIPLLLC